MKAFDRTHSPLEEGLHVKKTKDHEVARECFDMNYWLNQFTVKTWQEFCRAGKTVTGFPKKARTINASQHVKEGDIFLCYLVGIGRWVGALSVVGRVYSDSNNVIWEGEEKYSLRFSVEPIVILEPEYAVPMDEFKGRLTFYQDKDMVKQWPCYVRNSLYKYENADAEIIFAQLNYEKQNPVFRPIDKKKLKNFSNLYPLEQKNAGRGTTTKLVSIPTDDEDDNDVETTAPQSQYTHTEIQFKLTELGKSMEFSVRIPKNDRNREWNNQKISSFPLLDSLPIQFKKGTHAIIQNIDVIWYREDTIEAAFEVEHTTSIYSGLLRMSDLLVMQPNIEIKLYLVAPDERFDKFVREIPRPTFLLGRKQPLYKVCKFLPYSKLCELLNNGKDIIKHLNPGYLDEIAESYDPAEYQIQ